MKRVIDIGKRAVGPGHPVYVIAEIGSNHDSDLEKAKELIRACKYAGADAVKFQSFTAEGLLNQLMPDKNGAWVPHPAFPALDKLTVPEQWHRVLMEFSRKEGITFLSAPFEAQRARLLNDIGVEAFKIASGDLTNEPLLREVAAYKKPVIISTGAAYLHEVKRAVDVMAQEHNDDLALLHCASLYPPSYEDVNIRAMTAMKEEFGCPVGFSDHTPGSTVPVAAVALGASIIEKHITLDRKAPGPDHAYAMEVEEFKGMVTEIRNLEKALGDGVKRPAPGEEGERVGARRSIYAGVDIGKGEIISEDKLKIVRHAYGLEPRFLHDVIGKTAATHIARNMPLKKEDICG
ncbi:MAG: N-acetylneuraminate synthase family protein [Deltaproteobacteria bacterium]